MKTYQGIDLSHWNVVNSWAKVHDDNDIDFIILKAGGGDNSYTFKDPKFLQFYNACKMYEIPVLCCGRAGSVADNRLDGLHDPGGKRRRIVRFRKVLASGGTN